MSQHELNSDRDPLLNTTPSSIRNATFFLKPFYIAEASANFFGGTMMLIFARPLLSAMSTPKLSYPLTPTTTPSTASIQLLQWLGGLTLALSAPLFTACRSSANAQERRASYITLATGEVFLIAVMALQMVMGGNGAFGQQGDDQGGLTVKALGVAAGVLLATVVPRAWVLWARRGWFEDVDGGEQGRDTRPKSRAS